MRIAYIISDITPHQEIYYRDTAIGELFSNDKVEYLVEAVQKTFKWDLEEKKELYAIWWRQILANMSRLELMKTNIYL